MERWRQEDYAFPDQPGLTGWFTGQKCSEFNPQNPNKSGRTELSSGLHTHEGGGGGGTRHVDTHLKFQDRRITENLKLAWATVGFGPAWATYWEHGLDSSLAH